LELKVFDIQGCVFNVACDASISPIKSFFQLTILLAPRMFLDVSIDHGEASKLEVSES
jgi:hypothetical protein